MKRESGKSDKDGIKQAILMKYGSVCRATLQLAQHIRPEMRWSGGVALVVDTKLILLRLPTVDSGLLVLLDSYTFARIPLVAQPCCCGASLVLASGLSLSLWRNNEVAEESLQTNDLSF